MFFLELFNYVINGREMNIELSCNIRETYYNFSTEKLYLPHFVRQI